MYRDIVIRNMCTCVYILPEDSDLLRIYGPQRCRGASPVDLARLQIL